MVEELQRRNYSPATIRGYVLAIKQFADYFGKPPDRLGATHIQRFQWYLLQERKLTPVTVEIRMSALRFFFKKMLKRRDIHWTEGGNASIYKDAAERALIIPYDNNHANLDSG
jgi:hypothetical protein